MLEYKTLKGDAGKVIQSLTNNKYKLVVTSPPYYQHRSYGVNKNEIGNEQTSDQYIDKLVSIFVKCKDVLVDDGSLFIVIGDTRRNRQKMMIPHRLALKLVESGYYFQEDIIWYKKNAMSNSSKTSLTQAYEYVLFLTKSKNPSLNMDNVRVRGNETMNGNGRRALEELVFQFESDGKNTSAIKQIQDKIHNATPATLVTELPSTSEIARAYGYDPEKHCPTCHRKFKRHATRKRFGGHKHYPIFAACNPNGKNPGNVWEISTKAHHGNEHFAMFPEDLITKIIKFSTNEQDYVLDPFAGRGTTGIVCACLNRGFTGIELYAHNVSKIKKNIADVCSGVIEPKILKQIMS